MNRLLHLHSPAHQTAALHLAFIFVSVLLACGVWLLSCCSRSYFDKLSADVFQHDALLARQQELSNLSVSVSEELVNVTATLQQLRSKFPNVPEESAFLQQLSERATDNKVLLGEFRPGSTSKRSNCKEIDLKLRATGRYADICRWLDSFESLPRLVNVSQFSLTGPAAPGGDCVVDVQLSLLFGLDS